MFYFIVILGVAALVALYKFLPNRKIFMFICATLIIVFCISAVIQMRYSESEVISRAEIEDIRQQQKIFGDWYAAYQKDIDHLDRNWQLYHSIIKSLKTAEIYELSTYEQLLELEADALDEQAKINKLKVPEGLDEKYTVIISEIIKKTQTYVDAQTKTISTVRMAADPVHFTTLKNLNAIIKNVTIRESPAGLFTATEIAAIREMLVVPGEEALQ